MSANNIPLEIQVEIMKRVPVKSLIRFRSLSKQWKSVIDSPEFVTDHRVNQTQTQLLVMYCQAGYKYDSFVDDDDSLPHHKFSPTVTPTLKLLRTPILIGCSHGLVCLSNICKRLIVLWNPSIRRSFGILLPAGVETNAFGFGVCSQTFDPKIVKITRTIHYHYEAQVFTLSSRAWRSISSMNLPLPLPHQSMHFSANAVVIHGVIHWLAFGLTTNDSRIISFDLTREEFGHVVDLPDNLACRRYLDISKLNESLVVLDYYCTGHDAVQAVCDAWIISTKSSFNKLFTLKDVEYKSIIGFRKNGQPMMHGSFGPSELEVYEPASDNMNGIGIYGSSFKTAYYTESLLLLNQSKSIIE